MTFGQARSFVALILAVAVALGGCGGVTPSTAGISSTVPDLAPASARPTIVPIPGHEVYGFVPYWEMDDSIVEHIAATDLTTLGLFSVTHRRNGELDDGQNG